jgi:hypothetical protein
MIFVCGRSTSCAKAFMKLVSHNPQKSIVLQPDCWYSCWRREAFAQVGVRLSFIRRIGRYVDQARDVRIGVADQNGWSVCCARGLRVVATSSASVVSAFCAAVTVNPLASSSGITLLQLVPSTKAPWTSAMFVAPEGAVADSWLRPNELWGNNSPAVAASAVFAEGARSAVFCFRGICLGTCGEICAIDWPAHASHDPSGPLMCFCNRRIQNSGHCGG